MQSLTLHGVQLHAALNQSTQQSSRKSQHATISATHVLKFLCLTKCTKTINKQGGQACKQNIENSTTAAKNTLHGDIIECCKKRN